MSTRGFELPLRWARRKRSWRCESRSRRSSCTSSGSDSWRSEDESKDEMMTCRPPRHFPECDVSKLEKSRTRTKVWIWRFVERRSKIRWSLNVPSRLIASVECRRSSEKMASSLCMANVRCGQSDQIVFSIFGHLVQQWKFWPKAYKLCQSEIKTLPKTK